MRIEKLLDSKDDLSTNPLILDEKLILEESLDLAMIKLENDLVILILQDYSPAEITEELGISKRTVQRVQNDILEILTLEINVTSNRFR